MTAPYSVLALLVACLYSRASAARGYSGSFNVNLPFDEIEALLVKMEAVTDVIQTMRTEQENMKRDQDDLKEHILKRLDGLDEKTEWLLTNGRQGAYPLNDRITYIEKLLNESIRHTDCQSAYNQGFTMSGVYVIYPDGIQPMRVYCEQNLDGGGWTVFQSRQDGSVDFYRDWAAYKAGFGNVSGEFWLGNDNIHLLTKDHDQKLKIELKYDTETAYADYSSFWIDDESEKYKLNVSGFSGANPPGDSFMRRHSGKPFTTKDRDNDNYSINCAVDRQGAWWYDSCHDSNLNGPYGSKEMNKLLNWEKWKGWRVILTATRMMIKRK